VPGVVGSPANGHGAPGPGHEHAGRHTDSTLNTIAPSDDGRSGITLGEFGISAGFSRVTAAKLIVLPFGEKPEPRMTTLVPIGPELGESETSIGPAADPPDPPDDPLDPPDANPSDVGLAGE
jgi:hypothetical protein